MSTEAAAWGAYLIAASNMIRAIKAVSSERGRDPREYALVAFGGNGPLFAAAMAEALTIRRVLIPPSAGVFSFDELGVFEIWVHPRLGIKEPHANEFGGAARIARVAGEVTGQCQRVDVARHLAERLAVVVGRLGRGLVKVGQRASPSSPAGAVVPSIIRIRLTSRQAFLPALL